MSNDGIVSSHALRQEASFSPFQNASTRTWTRCNIVNGAMNSFRRFGPSGVLMPPPLIMSEIYERLFVSSSLF